MSPLLRQKDGMVLCWQGHSGRSTAVAGPEEEVAELRKRVLDSLSIQETLRKEAGGLVSIQEMMESTTRKYEMIGEKVDVKAALVNTACEVLQGFGTPVTDLEGVTDVVLKKFKARWHTLEEGKPVEVSGEENARKKRKPNVGAASTSTASPAKKSSVSELQVQEKMFLFCKVVKDTVPSVCWTAHDTSRTPIPGFSAKPDISFCESKTHASMPQMVTVLEVKSEIWSNSHDHGGIGQLIERSQLMFKQQPTRAFCVAALVGDGAVQIWQFWKNGLNKRSERLPLSFEDASSSGLELLMRFLLATRETFGYRPLVPKFFPKTPKGAKVRRAEPLVFKKERTTTVYCGIYELNGTSEKVAIKTGRDVTVEQKYLEKLKDIKGVVQCKEYWEEEDGSKWLVTSPFGRSVDGSEPDVTLRVIAEVANIIGMRHEKSTLHRDISIGNIIFTEGSSGLDVYLIDFATAAEVNDEGKFESTDSATGTYNFMAISVHDDGKYSVSSELEYLFYVLLHVALAGSLPWRPSEVGYLKGSVRAMKFSMMRDKQQFKEVILGKVQDPKLKLATSRLRDLFFKRGYKEDVTVEQFSRALKGC